jgi:hypothetical protein
MPPGLIEALLEELEASGKVAALAMEWGLDPARVMDRLRRKMALQAGTPSAAAVGVAIGAVAGATKPKAPPSQPINVLHLGEGATLRATLLPPPPSRVRREGRKLSHRQVAALAAICALDHGQGVASGEVGDLMDKAGDGLNVPSKIRASRIQAFFAGLEKRGYVEWPPKGDGFLRKAFATGKGRAFLARQNMALLDHYCKAMELEVPTAATA